MCAMCVPGACRGQKRVSDPLELELQMVVSHNAGAGNRPWNFWYSSQSHSPHIQSFNKDNKDINCCLDGVSLLCPALELTEDVCTV